MTRDPDKPYREYQLANPILIAKVQSVDGMVSFSDIATWCNGEVIRSHSKTSKVTGIRLGPESGEAFVPVGQYIVKSVNGDYFFKVDEHQFRRGYRRWTKRERDAAET